MSCLLRFLNTCMDMDLVYWNLVGFSRVSIVAF